MQNYMNCVRTTVHTVQYLHSEAKMRQITFSQAIEGYYFFAEARGLSPNTIRDYANTYNKFRRFLQDDLPVAEITHHHIEAFLFDNTHLSKKTRLNYHISLSALWTWLVKENIVETNILRKVAKPKPERRAIDPFTEQDIKLLLVSCKRSSSYQRPGQIEPGNHALPNPERNEAIILTLLDTGMRSSELCSIQLKHVDLRNRKIKIVEGKGDKDRVVPLSARTCKAIWKYLATREHKEPVDYLFTSKHEYPLSKHALNKLMTRLGKRADVPHVHPYRFRHTFAITYLRNGGDPFTLQHILGHSDMTMTRRYLNIAKRDIESGHFRASPVANWNL